MSGDALGVWTRPARRRAALDLVALWLPLVLVAAAMAWRFGGVGWAVGVSLAGVAALVVSAFRVAGRFDRRWAVRRLDARAHGLEDSADLLFATAPLTPFQQLQRDRIARRLADLAPNVLTEGWSARRIALAWVAGLGATLAPVLWPAVVPAPPPLAPSAEGTPAIPGVPRLIGQRVRIVPPAYTGLPPRYADSLDLRAPVGSRIEWTLAFAPQPHTAALELLGGQHVPLVRTGAEWAASLRLDRPGLYRVVPAGTQAQPPLHRLEAIADAPPQVRVVEPAQGLVLVRDGQRDWRVIFEATDDYAVAPTAKLTVTLAQGEGENVTFRERSLIVRGVGDARRKRFTVGLNLAAYGLQPGGDLIAQLTVADTRSPAPQVVRGPGVVLRWPAKAAQQASGLEMMSKRVMPAYFRSQRQIIIDTEKLIRERRGLAAEPFLQRSDAIGVDQRLLRLRYGQFVGEEAEGGPKSPPLPTADADNDTPAPAEQHSADDGHDHGGDAGPQVFGSVGNVLAEYGHTHDEAEAATLLDPDTRALLKVALDQMWQSETELRSGRPEAALPFEYKALDYIKRIQQATRIYLARVGTQLPPLDLARRMTGKRAGLESRPAPLEPFVIPDEIPAEAWRTLAGPGAIDVAGLDRWVRANAARIRDPLALLAAADAVRNAPDCAACRARLRGQLWAVLTRPPAQVKRRGDGGAMGRRYLRDLR